MANTGNGYDVSPEAVGKSRTTGSDTPRGVGKWLVTWWAVFAVVLIVLAIGIIVTLVFAAGN
ncbi:MAG: hypothetical protein M3Q71_24520 [Chloroflexota bacterium]|nr:hypothetical protein [Chloroflexota bacterium]